MVPVMKNNFKDLDDYVKLPHALNVSLTFSRNRIEIRIASALKSLVLRNSSCSQIHVKLLFI